MDKPQFAPFRLKTFNKTTFLGPHTKSIQGSTTRKNKKGESGLPCLKLLEALKRQVEGFSPLFHIFDLVNLHRWWVNACFLASKWPYNVARVFILSLWDMHWEIPSETTQRISSCVLQVHVWLDQTCLRSDRTQSVRTVEEDKALGFETRRSFG